MIAQIKVDCPGKRWLPRWKLIAQINFNQANYLFLPNFNPQSTQFFWELMSWEACWMLLIRSLLIIWRYYQRRWQSDFESLAIYIFAQNFCLTYTCGPHNGLEFLALHLWANEYCLSACGCGQETSLVLSNFQFLRKQFGFGIFEVAHAESKFFLWYNMWYVNIIVWLYFTKFYYQEKF